MPRWLLKRKIRNAMNSRITAWTTQSLLHAQNYQLFPFAMAFCVKQAIALTMTGLLALDNNEPREIAHV
jgi:hypothetical protein